MQRLFPALWVVLFLVVSPLHAEPKVYGEQRIHRWWDAVTDDIAQTWEQPDRYDLYLPFLSWHARFMYDKEKTDNYNEMPWGGGLGVSRYNDEGNWSDFRLGLGAAAGITARDDFANYVPLPFIFPLFSAGYKRVTVQFTYIPGTYNNGNVLFAWLRLGF